MSSTYTLHLPVIKALGSIAKFKTQVNNLILFFSTSPRQSTQLKKAQKQIGGGQTVQLQKASYSPWRKEWRTVFLTLCT